MRLARSQATDAYDPEAERRSRLCTVVTQKLDVAQGGESETGSLRTDRTRTPSHMLLIVLLYIILRWRVLSCSRQRLFRMPRSGRRCVLGSKWKMEIGPSDDAGIVWMSC
jgi:hypothetical protein